MLNNDNSHLLSELKSGDLTAFELVFRLYVNPLRLSAFLLLRHEQEAEDLVQQLFLDIWNQQLYRNIECSLKAYLHTAIKHRCLNHLKKLGRETQKREAYARQTEHEYDLPSNIDFSNSNDDQSPQLLTVLDRLPVQQSKVVRLIHMENKRYQDAALEMGISINSVKSHLKLAVKFLRRTYKPSSIHPIDK